MELHRGVTARPRPHPASLFNDQANLLSPGAGMIYFHFWERGRTFDLLKIETLPFCLSKTKREVKSSHVMGQTNTMSATDS